jgi:hypothetical protein
MVRMTVSITLGRKPYSSVKEQAKSRYAFAYGTLKWFSAYFEARNVEVWADASDEALGGRQLDMIRITQHGEFPGIAAGILQKYESGDTPLSSIILVIRGVWKHQGLTLPAYIGINNLERWRENYGDIEVNTFTSGDVNDVVELIWKDEEMLQGLVNNYMEEFGHFEEEGLEMESIVYCLGVPNEVNLSKWLASYYKTPIHYFTRLLGSVESENPRIHTYVRLINRLALASDLYDIKFFRDHIKELGGKRSVDVDYRSSIKLIGYTPESYGKFYEDLAKSIMEVLTKSLPKDSEVDELLRTQSARLAGYDTFPKTDEEEKDDKSTKLRKRRTRR